MRKGKTKKRRRKLQLQLWRWYCYLAMVNRLDCGPEQKRTWGVCLYYSRLPFVGERCLFVGTLPLAPDLYLERGLKGLKGTASS